MIVIVVDVMDKKHDECNPFQVTLFESCQFFHLQLLSAMPTICLEGQPKILVFGYCVLIW